MELPQIIVLAFSSNLSSVHLPFFFISCLPYLVFSFISTSTSISMIVPMYGDTTTHVVKTRLPPLSPSKSPTASASQDHPKASQESEIKSAVIETVSRAPHGLRWLAKAIQSIQSSSPKVQTEQDKNWRSLSGYPNPAIPGSHQPGSSRPP